MIFCRYITNILSVHFLQFYSSPPPPPPAPPTNTFKCLATLLGGCWWCNFMFGQFGSSSFLFVSGGCNRLSWSVERRIRRVCCHVLPLSPTWCCRYARNYIPAAHYDIVTPDIAKQLEHLKEIQTRSTLPTWSQPRLVSLIIPTSFRPLSVILGKPGETMSRTV